MAKNSYINDRNIDCIQTLDRLLLDMPEFCVDFFVGIQNRTTPLTRINYAYDLRVFFDYYVKAKKLKIDIKNITLQNLETLTTFDIEIYLNYLNNYFFNNKQSQCGEHAKERKLCSLRTLIKYFFKKDLLKTDVGSKVSSVKIKQHNITRLDIDEVVKLLNLVEYSTSSFSTHQKIYIEQTRLRDLAILTLFLGTGIRVSELVGIDKNDIDFNNSSFKVVRKEIGRAHV
jgi:site-specific recombinase XerD